MRSRSQHIQVIRPARSAPEVAGGTIKGICRTGCLLGMGLSLAWGLAGCATGVASGPSTMERSATPEPGGSTNAGPIQGDGTGSNPGSTDQPQQRRQHAPYSPPPPIDLPAERVTDPRRLPHGPAPLSPESSQCLGRLRKAPLPCQICPLASEGSGRSGSVRALG
jgi:hypothetical protein